MTGLAVRIRAFVERSEGELAGLRGELDKLAPPAPPGDPRAAAIHALITAAFQETRVLYGQALSALPDRKQAGGFLDLAERSLLHTEELMAQARELARRAIDFGTG